MLKIFTCLKILIVFFIFCSMAYATDPGIPDSVIAGNLDGSPILSCPGDTINIPIWVKNDEDAVLLYFLIAIDDQYISDYLNGQVYGILDTLSDPPHWDVYGFHNPFQDLPSPGYSSYPLLCKSDDPFHMPYNWLPFNTQSEWVKVADFTFVLSSDESIIGDSIQVIEGENPILTGGICFTDNSGYNEWFPEFIDGSILIVPDGYAYFPGDVNMANGLWPPMVLGNDLTYLINYFKGAPTSPPCYMHNPNAPFPPGTYFWASADIDGNCIVMGSDVTRLVAYFRGAGVIEWCADYSPAWPPIPDDAPDGWPNCETPSVTGRVIPTGTGK